MTIFLSSCHSKFNNSWLWDYCLVFYLIVCSLLIIYNQELGIFPANKIFNKYANWTILERVTVLSTIYTRTFTTFFTRTYIISFTCTLLYISVIAHTVRVHIRIRKQRSLSCCVPSSHFRRHAASVPSISKDDLQSKQTSRSKSGVLRGAVFALNVRWLETIQ